MKVAMLHFHLRRGGVSSVMQRQAACLARREGGPDLAFVVGAASEAPSPIPTFVIPDLDYDSFTGRDGGDLGGGAASLAASIESALREAFPGGCDLLHVHNPLLRKNARLLGALRILQKKGQALLLQVHDLAEDFRPDVYDRHWPYPEACDYAVINARDRARLIGAGLESDHVHLLPNPVSASEDFSPRVGYEIESRQGRRTALYPVRAIRRKNLGEALLLSLFLPEGAELALTLPPTNPLDLEGYRRWKARVESEDWRLRFEAGLSASLAELYDLSFCVVSTSVKEGFGYSYIDPLVRGLPVLGRGIPHLLREFAELGLEFEALYGAIQIPREAIDLVSLRASLELRIKTMRRAFGPIFASRSAEFLEPLLEGLEKRFDAPGLDFGALDEKNQNDLLTRLRGDTRFLDEIADLNPFLADMFTRAAEPEIARRQRDAVLSAYNEDELGGRLLDVYRVAATRRARGRIDQATLLATYLEPTAFFLCAS